MSDKLFRVHWIDVRTGRGFMSAPMKAGKKLEDMAASLEADPNCDEVEIREDTETKGS